MSRTLGGAATDAEAVVEIGRFHVESKLGEGGMGVVLLANDPLLGRHVALKVLRRGDDGEGTEGARRRLLREAQGVAKLVHENVIVVHDVGTHDGQVYLAMEYVAGGTLRSWQAKRTWREVLATYVRAGRGLAAAHAAGLVHRDFKPDNVLVGDDGRVRVTDFGLVAAIGEAPGVAAPSGGELGVAMTRTGTIMGTPRYMAPEQHAATGVDARADQFAFCAALYEALYDAPPFPDVDYFALRARVLAGDVAPVPADSNVPVAVRDAVLRGLRVDRDERFGSMAELLAVLAKAEATAGRRAAKRRARSGSPCRSWSRAIAWGGWWVLHEPAHESARPIAAIPVAGTSTGLARPWADRRQRRRAGEGARRVQHAATRRCATAAETMRSRATSRRSRTGITPRSTTTSDSRWSMRIGTRKPVRTSPPRWCTRKRSTMRRRSVMRGASWRRSTG